MNQCIPHKKKECCQIHFSECTSQPLITKKMHGMIITFSHLLHYKKYLCNQSSHYRKWSYHLSTPQAVRRHKAVQRQVHGVCIVWMISNSHCKHVMLKGISQADVVKTPSCSLTHCSVMLVWRHQSVSQLISRKAFWVKLKALIIPNQYCQRAPWWYCEGDFGVIFLVKKTKPFTMPNIL